MLTFEEKYQAILQKDSTFEGIFITAVKSTGIFCRPSCTARKPNPENVTFYDSTREALQHGFRPCKVCRPMEPAGEIPVAIKHLLKELQDQPEMKIRDFHLRDRGLEPSYVRRWFKKFHHMTFHTYQRMLRINGAYEKISKGGSVTQAAFDSGYESLSGFGTGFQTLFGKNPSHSADKKVLTINRFTTPLGPMFACATDAGVCLTEFTDRRMLETEFKALVKYFDAVILPGHNTHLEQLKSELAEYFNGKRQFFTVPLDTPGTVFQRKVWEILQEIPYGETRSYKQQAFLMQNPGAVRAVASANGHNRVAIVIPCHRVIGDNGNLTGYAGGLARKKWLLEFEKKHAGKCFQEELDFGSLLPSNK